MTVFYKCISKHFVFVVEESDDDAAAPSLPVLSVERLVGLLSKAKLRGQLDKVSCCLLGPQGVVFFSRPLQNVCQAVEYFRKKKPDVEGRLAKIGGVLFSS